MSNNEDKKRLLGMMSDCVFEMEDEAIIPIVEEYIEKGYDPLDGILEGLVDGMNRAGVLYEEGDYFVTELLICSDAMYNGLNLLKPHLESEEGETKFKCVMGVIEGDTHDIGKNLVKIMLEAARFEIYDLGKNVPIERFIEKAKEVDADIIGVSTLMTTTMQGMKDVVEEVKKNNLRAKVMIGGGPVTQHYCDSIGADGFSENAIKAVELAKNLVNAS